jgi:hypothetical protein
MAALSKDDRDTILGRQISTQSSSNLPVSPWTPPKSTRDGRPIAPISMDNLWSIAESERDRFAQIIQTTLAMESYEGSVKKSLPGEYPIQVEAELWIKESETHRLSEYLRVSLSIQISVDPYKRRPLLYTVAIERPPRSFSQSKWDLSEIQVEEMVRYIAIGDRGLLPRQVDPDFFEHWETPRPSFFKSKPEENYPISELQAGEVGAPQLLVFGSIVMMIYASWLHFGWLINPPAVEFHGKLMIALVALWMLWGAYRIAKNRPVHHVIVRQPERAPRNEVILDSWQVSVPEGGLDFPAFKERIIGAIQRNEVGLNFGLEEQHTRSPRGLQVVEKMVVTKGQGNLHVHIHQFGRDAFVGWVSYLNWARWAETDSIASVVSAGIRREYKSLSVGLHVPTQYDLMELNALAETVHRNMVREIKSFLKEKELEADLDFHIIRGDRDKALKSKVDGDTPDKINKR